MSGLLLVLLVTFGSVLLGLLVRTLSFRLSRPLARELPRASRLLKLLAIFVLNPLPIANSFWRLSLVAGPLLAFPVLGVFSIAVGGAAAIAFNRIFRIPPKRAASVFTAGAFTNILSLGGLTVFAFFGHDAYALVPLFNTFISFSYYAVGFPLSHRLSMDDPAEFSFSARLIVERPYLLSPVIAMGIGLLLNVLDVPHPLVMDTVSSVLIPLASGLIGFSIGLTLFWGRIRNYLKEVALVAAIKFLVVPAIMIPLGIAIGLPGLLDGTAFKVLVILSVMPVAFNALVPPVVYGFDLDLANSAWIVTTLGLIPVLPIIYFVLVR